jgi:hypothetical protein
VPREAEKTPILIDLLFCHALVCRLLDLVKHLSARKEIVI